MVAENGDDGLSEPRRFCKDMNVLHFLILFQDPRGYRVICLARFAFPDARCPAFSCKRCSGVCVPQSGADIDEKFSEIT